MGLIASTVTFFFILYLGKINAITFYFFGIFTFALSLVITRLFDVQLTKATKAIVEIMASHRNLRDFVLNHF
jgi:hypothetical protein